MVETRCVVGNQEVLEDTSTQEVVPEERAENGEQKLETLAEQITSNLITAKHAFINIPATKKALVPRVLVLHFSEF